MNTFKCQSCEETYHLENDFSCSLNQCTCAFGTGMSGCAQDGTELCTSCDPGFFLNGIVCELKVCTCQHGLSSSGVDCPEHDEIFCSACYRGYTMYENNCIENMCYCENGAFATGIDCPEDSGSYCKSCDNGFYLTNDTQILRSTIWSPSGIGCAEKACTVYV